MNGKGLGPSAWLLLPTLLFVLLFFLAPLSLLAWGSLHVYEPGVDVSNRFTLAYYSSLLTDPHYLKTLWTSLRVAVAATLVCLLLGYPLAYLIARASAGAQLVLLIIVFAPLFVGVVVRAFAWSIMLRSDGLVNTVLLALGLVKAPVRLLFTEAGLIMALTHVFLPLMVLPVASVIQRIDPHLDEAGATLGAAPLRRFFYLLLPLSLPGVAAGCALVFCLSISAYVIPTLVAGERLLVMPVLVAQNFGITMNWPRGSAAAIVLVALTSVVIVVNSLATERKRRNEP